MSVDLNENRTAANDLPQNKSEMLQRYDEKGCRLSQPLSRSVAHGEGILHGASHTFIYKREGGELHFLLQRRSYHKDSFPGCLDVSSAGHVEFGSDFLETALKELSEELGIKVRPEMPEELFEQRVYCRSIFYGKEFIDREINKIYALEMDCDPSALCLQEEEVCEAVWKSAADILRMLDNGDSEMSVNEEEFRRVIRMLSERIN